MQFFAYQRTASAVEANKAKAGASSSSTRRRGEMLALANFPTYNPNDRANLTGEQLRNRALTDIFEPGSTMKPFTVALRRSRPARVHADDA